MYVITCVVCGNTKETKMPATKYCSARCRKKAEYKRNYPKTGRVCKQCSKAFETAFKRQVFCCEKCKNTYANEHRVCEHVCKGCGIPFVSHQPAQMYCSITCGLSHTKPEKTLICVDCGAPFEFTGRTRKLRCDVCWGKHKSLGVMVSRKKRLPHAKLGVGSGGHQLGKDNHKWNEFSRYHGVLKGAGYAPGYRRICYTVWAHQCAVCGASPETGLIDVHHINGVRDDSRLENLVPLCRTTCHGRVHRGLKGRTPEEYTTRFYELWPHMREIINTLAEISKTAELSGKTSLEETTRTEGSPKVGQGQRIDAEKI